MLILHLLDKAVETLKARTSGPDLLSQEEFDNCFNNTDILAVRKRIMKWLGGSSSKLVDFLETCLCNITKQIREFCTIWWPNFKKINIILYEDIPQENIFAFVWPKTFDSIIHSLFDNCQKYAFQGQKENKIVKVQIKHNKEKVDVLISDNGIGLRENLDGGISRIESKAKR